MNHLTPPAHPVKAWLLILLLGAACAGRADAQAPRPFLHPDRIRYDAQCLTIDGRDVFIYSGAFHFFRCPKELWRDRFQKIKDAGFNAVETYVPWNWCEREMPAGLDDFSKVNLTDLDDFLTMAEQFGLYVIVRPGPYICAEWDTGGYPQWLLTKRPDQPLRAKGWLRSDDPVYLAWCRHWYAAVCPVIAKHQITRKAPGQPGVILVQLENEYDYAGFPDEVMLNQVRALARDARAAGIDVPFISCWTHPVRGQTDPLLRQVFDACNFYPRWDVDGIQGDIEKLRREQPDAPLATTELQGGWFSQVGGKLSEDQDGVTAAQINNLTLFAIQNGDTILNYYMLFGGTNPDDWAARRLTTTYDYNAPIREWGGVGDRYQRVWALGHMLREHGARLARSVAVNCDVTGVTGNVSVAMRRAPDGSRYVFVRTSQHTEPRAGTAHVRENGGTGPELVFAYQLEPFGSKVLYLPPGVNDAARGEWLPEAAPAIRRPVELPAPVPVTDIQMRPDPGPAHWSPLLPGEDLAQAGVYDSHFIFYRADLFTPMATNLAVEYRPGESAQAIINGQLAPPVVSMVGSALFALPAGSNTVQLLYENAGHDNGGAAMEQPSGIVAAHLAGRINQSQPITGWRMQLVPGTRKLSEVKSDFDDHNWPAVVVDNEDANQLRPGQNAVFRAELEVSAAELENHRLLLNFARIDDFGWIYVNGKLAGKTTDWSRAYAFDVTQKLHPGRNTIAVVVKNDAGDGGLGLPSIAVTSKADEVNFAAIGHPAGDEARWDASRMAGQDWASATLGQPAEAAALTWYQMNFALPAPLPGEWVPWHLHLNASGDGFLYVNGHPLGRYWQAGPQHDFFLPECWLNFGPARTNLLTLNLCSTGKGVAIQAAVVEPYAGYAEMR